LEEPKLAVESYTGRILQDILLEMADNNLVRVRECVEEEEGLLLPFK